MAQSVGFRSEGESGYTGVYASALAAVGSMLVGVVVDLEKVL